MGWTDSHLHRFEANGKCYGVPDLGLGLDEENEDEIRLDQVLRLAEDRMIYEYDFGDGWEHEVVVEKLLSVVSGRGRYPMVTGGGRACPPEDCGGVPGYYHLLQVLADPDDPDHEDLLVWTGGDYEPERFDAQEVNRAFNSGWTWEPEMTEQK
jgi:hypothetical protein